MAMENEPFEDVFPIENDDFPLLRLITGVYLQEKSWMFSSHRNIACVGCAWMFPMELCK